MTKRLTKRSIIIIVLLLLILVVAGVFLFNSSTDKTRVSKDSVPDRVPDQVEVVKDRAANGTKGYAKQLDGTFGDQHAAMVKSGENEVFKHYNTMQATLDKLRTKSGAYFVYTLYPKKSTGTSPYIITVDGSEYPYPYGNEYEYEAVYKKAWDGDAVAADYGWPNDDEGKDLRWSGFAPIHDSKGSVVAILVMDYAAPEIFDYPEWTQDIDI